MNELEVLRESVRGLLGKPDAWQRLCAEVGVTGLLVPEEFGGAGAGMAEACVVLEELGRVLSPAPMLQTVIATQALVRAGDERHLRAIAEGTITPTLAWDGYVLPGDLVLAIVDGKLVELDERPEPLPTMDESRPLGRLSDPIGEVPMDIACTALAAEQVGAMTRALEITVEYAKTRVQFGRPIGSFQALQHRMADLHVLVETSRSVYLAAVAGATDPVVAKVHCSEAFQQVAAEMIQIHGGIGITWEHDAHRYFKRAHSSAMLFGHPRTHITRLAQRVLG
jgi:alkylation response protein AidB-like acyl-CoA dehydrogenase